MIALVPVVFISLALFGPLGWLRWRDRQRARALAVAADVHRVVNHALGGESLITVEAVPGTAWGSGQVVLTVPTDWEALMEPVWNRVLERLPAGYELVVRPLHVPDSAHSLKAA